MYTVVRHKLFWGARAGELPLRVMGYKLFWDVRAVSAAVACTALLAFISSGVFDSRGCYDSNTGFVGQVRCFSLFAAQNFQKPGLRQPSARTGPARVIRRATHHHHPHRGLARVGGLPRSCSENIFPCPVDFPCLLLPNSPCCAN